MEGRDAVGPEGDKLSKQKIVDILGVINPCGIFLMALFAQISSINDWALLCIEAFILLLSIMRIFLFRSTPKEKRRRYNMRLFDAPGLFGRDVLTYPYTQTIIILLFLIPVAENLVRTYCL